MRAEDRNHTASRQAITRRRFLIDSAKGAAAGVTVASAPSVSRAEEATAPNSRVVIVTHPGALTKGNQADSTVLGKMIDVGIKALTGKSSDAEAWAQIAQPGQRVTMKWNEMGWRPIQTHPELRRVVTDALVRHGEVDEAKVFQFSRREAKGQAGRLVDVPIPSFGKPARLRRLFTDFTDCLINLPVLKAHRSRGVCISMKNHFGSIANPRDYHPGSRYWEGNLGKSIVELNLHPAIKDKTRLIVCDALRPQWDQGPLHAPGRRWNENALIFAFDTVAIDAVGLDIIEKKRKTVSSLRRKWKLPYAREMLAYGQKEGLGVADLNRIEVERIELKA